MAGWLMALSRIALLNPPLFIEALDQAAKLYAEQVTARGGGEPMIRWDVLADQAREQWLPRDGNQRVDETA